MQNAKYTFQLSSWNFQKHMDNRIKINRDPDTHYIKSVPNLNNLL